MRSIMSSLLCRTLRFRGVSPPLVPRKIQSHFYSSLVSSSTRGTFSPSPSKSSLFLPFRFSSSSSSAAKRVGADENLKRVIESEIQCSEESDSPNQGGPLPDGFPFEIIDNPGEQTITLKRELAGETIQVEVHMPDMAGEEDEQDSEDDDEEDEDDKGSSMSSIYMIVTVVKGEGPHLEICCTGSPEEITIDSLLMKEPEGSSTQTAYEGPEFLDLDENLQKAFSKYLEVRGIKSSLINFLSEYMVNKDNREYLTWLKNMKEFVEK